MHTFKYTPKGIDVHIPFATEPKQLKRGGLIHSSTLEGFKKFADLGHTGPNGGNLILSLCLMETMGERKSVAKETASAVTSLQSELATMKALLAKLADK